jgi:hypothetical protein
MYRIPGKNKGVSMSRGWLRMAPKRRKLEL